MNILKKMERAYNCINNYRDSCDNDSHKEFIDIFFPMFFQENKHNLKISVGKRVSSEVFQSWLTVSTNSFNVVLAQYNNEPQFIIRDFNSPNSMKFCINLSLIKNLKINPIDNSNSYIGYQIDFNYNNEIDYSMFIVLNKN